MSRATAHLATRRPLVAALVAALFVIGRVAAPSDWQTSNRALAQETSADWESTGLGAPTTRLFTPTSGAFFAQTGDGLQRSDNGGASWRAVTLPPAGQGAPTIAVDPANHTTIFATGAEGLYKTSDDAATWTLVLSQTAYPVTSRVLSLAISPVDPGLLYVALAGPDISSSFRLVRSKDAGSTWQVLAEPQGALCGWSVSVLEAHRLDAQRAFRSAGCYAGRNFYGRLEQSADQGESWTPIFAPQPGESSTANTSNPKLIYPERLRGATPAMPARFYLAGRRDLRLGGGSSLFRTDDDGATWVDLFSYRGGQTLDQPNAPPATIPGQGYDPNAPEVRIGGLAFDPANPDRIFVGLNEILPSQQPTRTASRVLVSTDAGASWTALGNRDIGLVMDLASGTDGRNLYAATDQGVWRLSLSSESPTVPRDQEK